MMTLRDRTILRVTSAVALAAAVLTLTAPSALAYDGYVAPLQEIPFAHTILTGARSLGMGGVALATADDGSAMHTNPAALTRLRRVELSGGFSFDGHGIDGEALGSEYSTDITSTNLSALRFAYPFPTFRGSLVVALGMERVYGLDADFLASYDDNLSWSEVVGGDTLLLEGVWGQTEDLLSNGDIYAGTVAVAFDASENVSLGAAVSFIGGTYEQTFIHTNRDEYGVSASYETLIREIHSETDIAGLGLKVGALFYLTEQIAAGATVTLPTTLTFSGTQTDRVMKIGASPVTFTEIDAIDDEVTLPFMFGVGASWSPIDLVIVGCDYQYTNWSEMQYEGPVYVGDQSDRRDAYEATHDLNAGIEVTIPEMPIRLRGGYMSRPLSYRGLTIDTDRAYWTLGAGILIDTVLSIDFAWISAAYERSAEDYAFNESISETALLIEAAYRF